MCVCECTVNQLVDRYIYNINIYEIEEEKEEVKKVDKEDRLCVKRRKGIYSTVCCVNLRKQSTTFYT